MAIENGPFKADVPIKTSIQFGDGSRLSSKLQRLPARQRYDDPLATTGTSNDSLGVSEKGVSAQNSNFYGEHDDHSLEFWGTLSINKATYQ